MEKERKGKEGKGESQKRISYVIGRDKEPNAKRDKDDSNKEERREDSDGSQEWLPCLQALLLESGIYFFFFFFLHQKEKRKKGKKKGKKGRN